MKLTEQEIEILKQNFNKKTLKQIMSLMPRPMVYSRFRIATNKLGFKRDVSKVKIPKSSTYDLEFWQKPNLLNCYFAGHIASDGCLMKNRSGYRLSIFTAGKDEIIIDNYIKFLNYKGKKEKGNNRGFSSEKKDLPYCKIVFCSFDKNAEYLKQYFNIEPRKTERLGPTNLNNKYLNLAYFIGLIDGDGSIFSSIAKKDGYKNIQISCCSCSKPIVEWLRDLLNNNFPSINYSNRIAADLSFHKINKVWSFGLNGLRAAVIINYLRQFPVPKLARKWDNPEVLAFIEEKKRQYPELFIEPDPAELAALMPATAIAVPPVKDEYLPPISLPPL